MSDITIIGFGCFGQALYRVLKQHFSITLYTRNPRRYENVLLHERTTVTQDVEQAFRSKVVFYCIPISAFENAIREHQQYFNGHLLIDVLAVKSYPAEILKKYLSDTNTRALLTHPLFGPNSVVNSADELSIVIDKFTATAQEYNYWKSFFEECQFRVIELDADHHDELAARSHAVTHLLGHMLYKFGFQSTPVDLPIARQLHDIVAYTLQSPLQFALDLQRYNPYTQSVRPKLEEAFTYIYHQMLPERTDPETIVYGIQGGKGSFNQEALNRHIVEKNITKYRTEYLYTTEKVLAALMNGDIDYGLFAIQNFVGGMVEESVYSMARYKFQIIDEFAIPIQHHLMKLPTTSLNDIDTIMAHPQVFKQCRIHLDQQYPEEYYKRRVGLGDLVDPAKAAQALVDGDVPSTTAILGAKTLAEYYQLDIIDRNLQDDPNNMTSFLLVARLHSNVVP